MPSVERTKNRNRRVGCSCLCSPQSSLGAVVARLHAGAGSGKQGICLCGQMRLRSAGPLCLRPAGVAPARTARGGGGPPAAGGPGRCERHVCERSEARGRQHAVSRRGSFRGGGVGRQGAWVRAVKREQGWRSCAQARSCRRPRLSGRANESASRIQASPLPHCPSPGCCKRATSCPLAGATAAGCQPAGLGPLCCCLAGPFPRPADWLSVLSAPLTKPGTAHADGIPDVSGRFPPRPPPASSALDL